MDIRITTPKAELPIDRAYTISMTIASFKGRRDVQVHLFRPEWDPEEDEAYYWDQILGGNAGTGRELSPETARKVILEAFTLEERDQIIDYLKDHYETRLSAIESSPMAFPAPLDLTPLCDITEGKSIGHIRFEKIPHFNLPFPMRGLYDLNSHKPVVEPKS